MLNIMEVHETNQMIEQEKLDVRTITMGISLLDCASDDVDKTCDNIYRKITTYAKDLVSTGKAIERDYGIPIVNKRITVTPISLVGASSCKTSEDFVKIAHALDKAAKEVGVDLIGGYSALVSKSMTPAEELLIRSLPQALSETDIVCSSVNVGSTKTGIDMNAVELLGHIIKDVVERTADNDSYGCVKFVAFCNVPDDNPFMAGERTRRHRRRRGHQRRRLRPLAWSPARSMRPRARTSNLCETIKRTAFKITRGPARLRRLPAASASRSASSTCRSPRPRPWATWVKCWRRSASSRSALPAPQRRSPCSTTRSRRAASWRPPTWAACPARSSRSPKTRT